MSDSETPTGAPAAVPQGPSLPEGIVIEDGKAYVTAKVDGEEQRIPLDEARIRLQKATAAEKRFQEASNKEKSLKELESDHQTALKYYELSRKALSGDEDAGRQALKLMGVELDDEPGTGSPAPRTPAPVDPRMEKVLKLVEEYEKAGLDPVGSAKYATQQEAERIRNQVFGDLDAAASQDKELSSILTGAGPRAARVKQMLRDAVAHKIRSEGLSPSAPLYAQVVRETKAALQELGTLDAIDRHNLEKAAPFLSLGPAAGNADIVGALKGAKRPEYVSPYKQGASAYGQSLLARWAFDTVNTGD